MKIIPHLFLRLWLFANAFKCDCITPNDEQFTNYPVEVISSETFGLIHNKDLSYRRINMHEIDKTVSQSQCYEFCMKNCVWHCSIAILTSFYVISTWKWTEHIIGYTHMAKNNISWIKAIHTCTTSMAKMMDAQTYVYVYFEPLSKRHFLNDLKNVCNTYYAPLYICILC